MREVVHFFPVRSFIEYMTALARLGIPSIYQVGIYDIGTYLVIIYIFTNEHTTQTSTLYTSKL